MIEKVWRVDEWRAEAKRTKNKDQLALYSHMKNLSREIFAAALIKHSDPGEAIMAVYLTGLYHATTIPKENSE